MHNWFGVAIDFVIVVLGVYVAVWVGSQQAAREQERRTAKVVAALRQDLRDSTAVEEKFNQALDTALTAFKVARERGEMPPPVFLRISGSDTPPRSPCVGMLQGEIAALIDPALLWEICFYYDERDGIGQKFVRYSVFTENEILPRSQGRCARVLHEGSSTSRPRFEAHMDRLQEWRRDSATLRQWARCLDDRLREPSTAGPSCRPAVGGTIDVGGPR
jgi:hypothetical protein